MAPPPSSHSLLPAWAGGFSLGVFCLAALQWLNGVDFVLFPPPAASMPLAADAQVGENGENETKGDAEIIESQQEEEEEDTEYEEEESGSDEVDVGLSTILNGTSNADNFHTDNSHPSYNELAVEIRALTSAIHSYRDVQERAIRAASAREGRAATDDAMDFLRRKRLEAVPEAAPSRSEGDDVPSGVKDVATVASLLAEASVDLSRLKESIEHAKETDANGDEPVVKIDKSVDDADRAKQKNTKDEQPAVQIDKVVEKIQKVLAVVEASESGRKGRVNPDGGRREGAPDGGEREGRSAPPELAAIPTESTTPSVLAGEKMMRQGDDTQQQPKDGSTSADERLEGALATLANSNDAADLKAGAQMLYLYCLNMSKNPSVPRYRKIYTNNATFKNKVGNLAGARELLVAVGFEERDGRFEWAADSGGGGDDDPLGTKSRLDLALAALDLMKSGSKGGRSPSGEPGPDERSVTFSSAPPLDAGAGGGADARPAPLARRDTAAIIRNMESLEDELAAEVKRVDSFAGGGGRGADLI